jgi:hypothetical protein
MTEKKRVAIDSQVLTSIQNCHELTNLTFLQNWRPNVKPEPFEKGDLGHVILQNYYSVLQLQQETGIPVDRLQLIRDSVQMARAKSIGMDLPDSEVERLIKIYTVYFDHYLNDTFKILAVERAFTKLLYSDDELEIYYEGIIDLLYESQITKLTVMDHKTKGKQYSHVERDNQFIGYAWAFETNWVIVNGIGLQIKPKSEAERYKRQVLSISDALKEQWKKSAIKSIKNFLAETETEDFHKNIAHCKAWGGCLFRETCNADDPDVKREILMRMFYQGAKWSPYNRG